MILFKIKPLCSNNEAKYEALIVGLKTLLNLGARHVLIKGDYELIINQLIHKFKCIKSNLLKYFSYASKLLSVTPSTPHIYTNKGIKIQILIKSIF